MNQPGNPHKQLVWMPMEEWQETRAKGFQRAAKGMAGLSILKKLSLGDRVQAMTERTHKEWVALPADTPAGQVPQLPAEPRPTGSPRASTTTFSEEVRPDKTEKVAVGRAVFQSSISVTEELSTTLADAVVADVLDFCESEERQSNIVTAAAAVAVDAVIADVCRIATAAATPAADVCEPETRCHAATKMQAVQRGHAVRQRQPSGPATVAAVPVAGQIARQVGSGPAPGPTSVPWRRPQPPLGGVYNPASFNPNKTANSLAMLRSRAITRHQPVHYDSYGNLVKNTIM